MNRQFCTLTALVLMSVSAAAAETPPNDAADDAAHNAVADEWEQMLPAAEIRADFAELYAGLRSAHADLYAQREQAAYDARFDAMLETFTAPMRRFDVHMAFQRFAAFGNVGHARIAFPSAAYQSFRDRGGKVLALYPRVVDGVVYVGHNLSSDARVRVGDELIAINDQPIARWLERAAEHISADTPYLAQSLMEFSFPRDLWALVGEQAAFEVTLRRNGKPFTLSIAATTAQEQSDAVDAQEQAFALDSNTRSFRMLDERTGYLMPGPFYNIANPARPWDTAAFTRFIDDAFAQLSAAKASDLIIDLRQNPGGDNSFSDPMLAWFADEPFRFYAEFLIRSSREAQASNAARLAAQDDENSVSARFAQRYAEVPHGEVFPFDLPFAQPRAAERFTGRVVALVNRHSFSNAVNVAAIIQDYGFGLIAGEKTADMATTYGSMEQFTLSRTGISVGFPKAHIIRPSGERRPDGVTPDWSIPSPVGPTQDDEVLDALLERLRNTHED